MRRLVLACVVLPLACAKARTKDDRPLCVDYAEDIAPVLEQRCNTCHADGVYVTTSYFGLFGTGTDDVPNVIAKDPSSKLLTQLDPATADENHIDGSVAYDLIETWIVDCEAPIRRGGIHEPGILNPDSPEWHANLIVETGYDFDRCADCHGRFFSGGTASSTCLGCHEDGPTDCSVCHGDLDAPHVRHADRACSTCHVEPERYDAQGHLDGVVQVAFGDIATGGTFGDAGCQVYCHGPQTLAWDAGRDDACGTCHELPPPDHVRDDCEACHQLSSPDPSHVDGVVSVGTTEDCDGCHVQSDRSHRVHLMPRLGLTSSMRCEDCHLVPEEVSSPGHIDSVEPAEVFVAEILPDSLAAARGATPAYDDATKTCSGVYCHGTDTTIAWTDRSGTVYCGTCHAIPPPTDDHVDAAELSTCVDCHATSVDRFGNVIENGGEREHLDGEVDQ